MKVTNGALPNGMPFYAGRSGKIVADILKGDIMKVSGKVFRFPEDFDTIKLISTEKRRAFGVGWTVLLLMTGIGVLVVMLAYIVGRRNISLVGFKLKDGSKLVAECSEAEWTLAKKYVGDSVLDTF